jgi:hypothetical protein
MVEYGLTCFNQVPIIECMRCGVYPLFGHDATSPPILAGAGYAGGIFSSDDEPKWGALGAFDVTFQRFLCSIGLSCEEVVFDPLETAPTYVSKVGQALAADVLLVSIDPDVQPSAEFPLHTNTQFVSCVAVVFGNGAHYFSVIKGFLDDTWTVKDAMVQEFRTLKDFNAAAKAAYSLHGDQNGAYSMLYAVYARA